MAEKITPEEKLLKLIENPAADKAAKPLAKKSFRLPVNPPNLFKFKFARQCAVALADKLKFYLVNLKIINRGAAVISGVMTVFLIFDFIKSAPDLSRIYSPDFAAAPKTAQAQESKMLKLQDYLGEFAKRDIFHFIPVTKVEKAQEGKDLLASVTAHLKLVGIIWSQNPQAMIEDKKENKTLLVNEGDSIGDIEIKQILRNKVILGFQNNEIELL